MSDLEALSVSFTGDISPLSSAITELGAKGDALAEAFQMSAQNMAEALNKPLEEVVAVQTAAEEAAAGIAESNNMALTSYDELGAGVGEAMSTISEGTASASESLDMLASGGGAAGSTLIEVLLEISDNVKNVQYAVDGMSSSVTGGLDDLAVEFTKVSASATATAEATAEAGSSASEASSGGFMDLFNKIGFGIMNFQNYLNIAKQVATGLLEPAISAETVTTALTTLDGSAKAAGQEMDKLNQFAAKTPFKTLDIDQAAEQLQGFGIGAQNVIPEITAIGDALGSVGRDTPAELDSVVQIFGKIHTEGKVTQMTMNELAVHGINGWQALADATGKTIPQVKELVKKGLLPADDAINDLTKGIEKNPLYTGGMAKAAGTFTGLMSTLQSNFAQVLASFGSPIIKALEGQLNNLGNLFASPSFQQFAGSVGQGIVGVFTGIGSAVGYVGNILKSLNLTDFLQLWHSIGDEIGSITNKFQGAGGIFKTLGTDMDPIANVIGTIAHIGLAGATNALGLISSALMNIDKAASGSGLSSLGGVFQQLSSIVGGTLSADFKTFSDTAQSLGKWWQSTMEPTIAKALPGFENLGNTLITTVVPALAQIWAVGQQVMRDVMPPLTKAFEAILPPVITVAGWLANQLGNAIKFLAPFAVEAAQAIGQFAGDIITRVIPIVQIFWNALKTGLDWIKPYWPQIWGGIQLAFTSVWDQIKGVIQIAWSIVSGVIKVGLDLLSGNWGQAWTDIKDMFSGIWDGIKSFAQGIWILVSGPIMSGVNSFKSWWSNTWNEISGNFSNIWNGLSGLASHAWNGTIGAIKGGINDVITLINNFIGGLDNIHVNIPGGGNVGFSIPKIPYLSTGGVVPPGSVAVAGDGPGPELVFGGASGATVMSNSASRSALGGKTEVHNHIYVDGKAMADSMMIHVLNEIRSSGHPIGAAA